MLTNEKSMGFPWQAWVEKIIHGVETHGLSSKEKVSGTAVSKEGHANSVLIDLKTNTVDFLEKHATISNASNCQLLKWNSLYLLKNSWIEIKVHKQYCFIF